MVLHGSSLHTVKDYFTGYNQILTNQHLNFELFTNFLRNASIFQWYATLLIFSHSVIHSIVDVQAKKSGATAFLPLL